MTDLYLIRHAESEANLAPHIISGRSNHTLLSKRGKRQALALRRRLEQEGIIFDEVYCSPALRTIETAHLSLPKFMHARICIADELQELDQGEWTGKIRKKIYTAKQLKYINSDNWNFAAPGGESQSDVGKRMYNLTQKVITKEQNTNNVKAFFTHGVAIKCLLSILLNSDRTMAWRWNIENTSITQMKYEKGTWWPVRINDYAHIFTLGSTPEPMHFFRIGKNSVQTDYQPLCP